MVDKATVNALVIVFAKAPVPGDVKTRLISTLGAEGAAMLHAALVERALDTVTRVKSATGALYCAPNSQHSFFAECADDFSVTLHEQGGGDLGQRMLRALENGLKSYEVVVVIGADCPSVTSKDIDTAIIAAKQSDVVLNPAADGGYVLIAASKVHAAMFDNIDWGTAQVFAQQLAQLERCGMRAFIGPERWDVDTPDDLAKLRTLSPALNFFWPGA